MCVSVSTGDEWPPGSDVFHLTFLPGPNSTGRFVAVETPVPLGPRKRVQFSDSASAAAKATADKSVVATIEPVAIAASVKRKAIAGRRE